MDPLLTKLITEKESGNRLQERKHLDWDDNYELYRNKVKTNRLTQRQAVMIPLMKETIKTILASVDDAPNIDWMEQGGNEDKEILFQELWDASMRENKVELIDIMDKKNVLLYGISTKMFNITEQGVDIDVLDTYDVTYDPLMQAGNIESARFIVRQNIFRTVREILADDRYTQEGKDSLKIWIEAPAGFQHSEAAREQWEAKMERARDMGVEHGDFPLYAGGDTLVNLTEHYTRIWDTKTSKWERRVVTYADNEVVLSDDSLKSLIGVDFWPFVVWNEDPETNDIYADSVADLVRTPNKVINVWFSQLVENRTLKNFQMHWYSAKDGYTAQTYTPGAGVMLPAPPGDDINKVIKPVEINGLDDTMDAINLLTKIVERGSGATAIEKGQGETGTQTLGEINVLVGKAMERSVSMAKFYRLAWYETAWKWGKLMHANGPKIIKLYKKGASGRVYTKKILRGDWRSDEGYEPKVTSTSEQESDSIKTIQKFTFLRTQFPGNTALDVIAQKRMLESVNLTPEELKQVTDAQDALQDAQNQQQQAQQLPGQPAGQVAPPTENARESALLNEIGSLTNELQ